MTEVSGNQNVANNNNAKIIYILYLVNIVVPFTGLVGLIMAYVNKADAPEWLQSHYQFQIRTFWISLLYLAIGLILSLIVVGFLVILFTYVWLIVRAVKGMQAFDKNEAHPNPTGWMF